MIGELISQDFCMWARLIGGFFLSGDCPRRDLTPRREAAKDRKRQPLAEIFIRLDDLSCNRRSSYDVGRCKVEFAGTAAPGKVSVLRADGYGLGSF